MSYPRDRNTVPLLPYLSFVQAASVVQAYPLVGTIIGIVFFREFRGVSRTARLLLIAQVRLSSFPFIECNYTVEQFCRLWRV